MADSLRSPIGQKAVWAPKPVCTLRTATKCTPVLKSQQQPPPPPQSIRGEFLDAFPYKILHESVENYTTTYINQINKNSRNYVLQRDYINKISFSTKENIHVHVVTCSSNIASI
jgi:hypothetical protein